MHFTTAKPTTLLTTLLTLSTTTTAQPHPHKHAHPRSLSTVLTPRDASSKRGLGYDFNSPASFSMWTPAGPKLSWCMNWLSASSNAGISCPDSYSYIPTLAGTTQNSNFAYWLAQWPANAAAAIKAQTGGTKYVLAFNEPDMTIDKGGCGMSVPDGVQAWKDHIAPLAAPDVGLGSPSVTSSGNEGMGIEGWLKPFLQQCQGCPIGFVQGHWYGCGSRDTGAPCAVQDDIDAFEKWVGDLVDAAALVDAGKSVGEGVKVWIPEFQRFGDMGGQAQFLQGVNGGKGALAILDGNDKVEKYAYFYDKEGLLIQGGGLSAVGQAYVS